MDINEKKTDHQLFIFEGISKDETVSAKKVSIEVYARTMQEATKRVKKLGLKKVACIPMGNVKEPPSLPPTFVGSPMKWKGSPKPAIEWNVTKNPLKALK